MEDQPDLSTLDWKLCCFVWWHNLWPCHPFTIQRILGVHRFRWKQVRSVNCSRVLVLQHPGDVCIHTKALSIFVFCLIHACACIYAYIIFSLWTLSTEKQMRDQNTREVKNVNTFYLDKTKQCANKYLACMPLPKWQTDRQLFYKKMVNICELVWNSCGSLTVSL